MEVEVDDGFEVEVVGEEESAQLLVAVVARAAARAATAEARGRYSWGFSEGLGAFSAWSCQPAGVR